MSTTGLSVNFGGVVNPAWYNAEGECTSAKKVTDGRKTKTFWIWFSSPFGRSQPWAGWCWLRRLQTLANCIVTGLRYHLLLGISYDLPSLIHWPSSHSKTSLSTVLSVMSKDARCRNLSNGIDPMDVIEKYGAVPSIGSFQMVLRRSRRTLLLRERGLASWNFVHRSGTSLATSSWTMKLTLVQATANNGKVVNKEAQMSLTTGSSTTSTKQSEELLALTSLVRVSLATSPLQHLGRVCGLVCRVDQGSPLLSDNEEESHPRSVLLYTLDKIATSHLHPIMPFVTEIFGNLRRFYRHTATLTNIGAWRPRSPHWCRKPQRLDPCYWNARAGALLRQSRFLLRQAIATEPF